MSRSVQITILLPFHRLDAYLRLALESLLSQTFNAFELLLLADARLCNVEESIHAMIGQDPRVQVLPSLSVGGLAATLNLGITKAKGKYIARMDSDDVSLPNRLEAQFRYMEAHPSVVVLGSRVKLIDERGEHLAHEYPFYELDEAIRSVLPLRNPMPHPALMFRKDVLVTLGGYKYAHSAEDWELFVRMARNPDWAFHNLDETLVLYRRHAGQITRPELMNAVFYDTSAFLFSEFLRLHSWKYLVGIVIKLPIVVRTRLACRSVFAPVNETI